MAAHASRISADELSAAPHHVQLKAPPPFTASEAVRARRLRLAEARRRARAVFGAAEGCLCGPRLGHLRLANAHGGGALHHQVVERVGAVMQRVQQERVAYGAVPTAESQSNFLPQRQS